MTIEDALFRFRDALSSQDVYIRDVFEGYDRDRVFEFLARMWVIARFDDQGLADELRQEHQRLRA